MTSASRACRQIPPFSTRSSPTTAASSAACTRSRSASTPSRASRRQGRRGAGLLERRRRGAQAARREGQRVPRRGLRRAGLSRGRADHCAAHAGARARSDPPSAAGDPGGRAPPSRATPMRRCVRSRTRRRPMTRVDRRANGCRQADLRERPAAGPRRCWSNGPTSTRAWGSSRSARTWARPLTSPCSARAATGRAPERTARPRATLGRAACACPATSSALA